MCYEADHSTFTPLAKGTTHPYRSKMARIMHTKASHWHYQGRCCCIDREIADKGSVDRSRQPLIRTNVESAVAKFHIEQLGNSVGTWKYILCIEVWFWTDGSRPNWVFNVIKRGLRFIYAAGAAERGHAISCVDVRDSFLGCICCQRDIDASPKRHQKLQNKRALIIHCT